MFPIKELITFGLASVAMIVVTGGPSNLRENLRKAQIQMIREVRKTSNWGDPLIWHQRPTSYPQKLISRHKQQIVVIGGPHVSKAERGLNRPGGQIDVAVTLNTRSP
jgi:hypothetical protein